MISVDVFAGSPSAEAKSDDFIFFDFLSFLESLSLPIVSCKVVGPRIVRRFYVRLDLKFSRSTGAETGDAT